MNTDKNMPCILLDREFNIISTDEQIQKKYPRLCSSDYIRSLMAGYTAEDFTEFRLINTAVLNSGKAHLAAFADGDFIRCYVLTSNIATVTERQKLINYQMREPVSSIFALLPVITDNINRGDSDKAIMYMDGIHSKSYKLLRNITNISIAEKIMDNTDFHTEKINLSSLLNSLVTSVMTVEKNVEIDCETEDNIIISGNLNLITNGILNLFANSFDYRQDGKTHIRIRLSARNKTAVFTYSDDSKGIKEEFQPYVFSPYFSKDPYADGEADPSLGLGLFIAKTAFTHAGAALLLSSEFGKGVKYSASFPVCESDGSVLKSTATDFLLNRYSEVFVQLCDSCRLPSLR